MKWINSAPARDALVLASFALIIGSALWITQWLTAEQIDINRQNALKSTIQTVLPQGLYNNNPIQATLDIHDAQYNRTVYLALKDDRPIAAAITALAPDGYSGDIRLLIGISIDDRITGVRVLSHRETPGLGDKIELKKSTWVLDFDNRSLAGETNWSVKKDGGDFDQFTGATITPRAVVAAVSQTLMWFSENKQQILEHSQPNH